MPLASTPLPGRTHVKELAARMAQVARQIRAAIMQAFVENRPSELLRDLQDTFAAKQTPEPAQFADMFAQVAVWSFFAAQCGQQTFPSQDSVATVAMPKTDSVLHRLLARITTPQAELVRLLDQTDFAAIHAVLRQGRGQQDAVAHLYESFLTAYDPLLRKACGVYSTPQPITSFIVRAVDDLLESRFGISAGLAGQGTPPRVVMIDPACGTGNFLCSAVAHIRERFLQQNDPQAWSGYVHRSLLPRLHGFELLPAPCAVAHLQLSRQLADPELSAELLGVHLTGSLEEMAERVEQILSEPDAQARTISSLARRAQISRHDTILIVMGNPPYRGISRTCSHWMARLLESYRRADGEPLRERKVWLKNDYVQFIRFSQWAIELAGQGILALVTDHSYLDSATFRGMRQSLLQTFDEINVLNLHGNAKRREKTPDGKKDDNVFDIRQGVAIGLFIKRGKPAVRCVRYEDVWGSRQSKYAYLAVSRVGTIDWKRIAPAAPRFELVPVDRQVRAEYERGWLIKEVFPVGSNGVQTSRDAPSWPLAKQICCSAWSPF